MFNSLPLLSISSLNLLFLFYQQIGSEKYHNETVTIQKRLQSVQLELSSYRQHLSTRQVNASAVSICAVNETSVWTPGPTSSSSIQLTASDYSLSACDITPPHVYTDVSEIQNNTNASPRHRNSKGDLQEPLYSSMQFPQNSTPRQTSSSNIQRECLSECVRHLVFGDDATICADGNQTATTLDNSLSLDSGYSSLPDPSCNCQNSVMEDELDTSFSNESIVDSDASDFFESPMVRRSVTHKVKKHKEITKQLKRIGKQIKKYRLVKTLAVL